MSDTTDEVAEDEVERTKAVTVPVPLSKYKRLRSKAIRERVAMGQWALKKLLPHLEDD